MIRGGRLVRPVVGNDFKALGMAWISGFKRFVRSGKDDKNEASAFSAGDALISVNHISLCSNSRHADEPRGIAEIVASMTGGEASKR
jgi:hypothetical protein